MAELACHPKYKMWKWLEALHSVPEHITQFTGTRRIYCLCEVTNMEMIQCVYNIFITDNV